jgi:nucleotide-binding universal stress UspA family protein
MHSDASLRGNGLGALDWELLQEGPAPVLFVKDVPNPQKLRCLAAVDLADESQAENAQHPAIAQAAQALAAGCNSDAHLMCVYDRSDGFAGVLRETLHLPGYEARKQRFDELANDQGVIDEHRHYVAGDPANTIASYIRRRGYQLLIVGACGPHKPPRTVGRTARRLLEHPPCSILVLKGQTALLP